MFPKILLKTEETFCACSLMNQSTYWVSFLSLAIGKKWFLTQLLSNVRIIDVMFQLTQY